MVVIGASGATSQGMPLCRRHLVGHFMVLTRNGIYS